MRSALRLVLPLLLATTGSAQEPALPRVEASLTVQAPAGPGALYREKALSGRAAAANGKTFLLGAGRYEFSEGRFWELTGKDGRPIGSFFVGKGALSFTPDDAQAARLAVRNAKHVGGASGVDGKLKAPFEVASFLYSDALRPDWAFEKAERAPDAELKAHLRRFQDDRTQQVESRLAVANAVKGRYFASTLEASSDLRHVFDAVTDDEEALVFVDRPSGLGIGFPDARFAKVIARQPIGRTRREAPRIDARLVAVDVEIEEIDKVWGALKVTETFVAARPIAALALDFDTETFTGSKFVSTRMRSLTDGDGVPLGYSLGQGNLIVALAKPVAEGTRVTLKLEYEAPYFERAGGDNVWELPIASGWYPQPVNLNASNHTFHAVVRTRKPFIAFPSGETVRREEGKDWNVVETRLDRPVPFATVIAGKYTMQESTEDGVTCRIASYGLAKEMSGKKLLNIFHSVRKFYTWLLGPFPWKEYTIIEINSYGFGQAPPGLMRITKEAFQSNIYTDQVSTLFSHGINQRVAHELAHSYFGYVVADASPSHQWISESFSEVVSMYAIERLKDKSESENLAAVWKSAAKESTKAAPIYLANELASKISTQWDESVELDRINLVYSKGALLLLALRRELGDDLFFTILRSFLKSFEKRQNATTDEFASLLAFVTKKDWKPWFDKYYYGTEMP
ncbi:MAG: hypothetical protein IPL90_04440 [Holophagales bacterium]|nr:hypothetical protein [Holophagales bacterium]